MTEGTDLKAQSAFIARLSHTTYAFVRSLK